MSQERCTFIILPLDGSHTKNVLADLLTLSRLLVSCIIFLLGTGSSVDVPWLCFFLLLPSSFSKLTLALRRWCWAVCLSAQESCLLCSGLTLCTRSCDCNSHRHPPYLLGQSWSQVWNPLVAYWRNENFRNTVLGKTRWKCVCVYTRWIFRNKLVLSFTFRCFSFTDVYLRGHFHKTLWDYCSGVSEWGVSPVVFPVRKKKSYSSVYCYYFWCCCLVVKPCWSSLTP